jgi:hypothetical protein
VRLKRLHDASGSGATSDNIALGVARPCCGASSSGETRTRAFVALQFLKRNCVQKPIKTASFSRTAQCSLTKGKRITFIFNDGSTGSCICLRLELYLSHVKIGARNLGSLCSILPFSHKKYPRQETVTYVASCTQGMFLVVPTFVARCHYVSKDARDPDGKIWNCEREGWPIKGVTSFVRYAVRDFYI